MKITLPFELSLLFRSSARANLSAVWLTMRRVTFTPDQHVLAYSSLQHTTASLSLHSINRCSAMADVEMKPTEEKVTGTETSKDEDAKDAPPPPTPLAEIKSNAILIERAVSTMEPRFTNRVLRNLTALRKRLDDKVLRDAIVELYPIGAPLTFTFRYSTKAQDHTESVVKRTLLSWLPDAPATEQSMDIDPAPTPSRSTSPSEPVPELEMYLRLLILYHLLKSSSTYGKAMELTSDTVQRLQSLNRRTMDPISAKLWFAIDRTYELVGELAEARPCVMTSTFSRLMLILHS